MNFIAFVEDAWEDGLIRVTADTKSDAIEYAACMLEVDPASVSLFVEASKGNNDDADAMRAELARFVEHLVVSLQLEDPQTDEPLGNALERAIKARFSDIRAEVGRDLLTWYRDDTGEESFPVAIKRICRLPDQLAEDFKCASSV